MAVMNVAMMHLPLLSLTPASTIDELRSALEWVFTHLSRSTVVITAATVPSVVTDLRAASALRALKDADDATIARARDHFEAAVSVLTKALWIFAGVVIFLLGHALQTEACSLCSVTGLFVVPVVPAIAITAAGLSLGPKLHSGIASLWTSMKRTRDPDPSRVAVRGVSFRSRRALLISDIKALTVNGSLLMILVLDVSTDLVEHMIGHRL